MADYTPVRAEDLPETRNRGMSETFASLGLLIAGALAFNIFSADFPILPRLFRRYDSGHACSE